MDQRQGIAQGSMKDAVKKTLIQFDQLCKEMSAARSVHDASKLGPKAIFRYQKRLKECSSRVATLQKQFDLLSEEAKKWIAKGANKHKARIQQIHQKLHEIVKENNTLTREACVLQEQVDASNQPSYRETKSIDELKKKYSTTFEIIKNFRETMPALYLEVERETGIFFFSLPTRKPNA